MSATSQRPISASLALLLSVIALAPLPLGSNRPLFESLLMGAAALLLMGCGWQKMRGTNISWRPLLAPALAFGVALILAFSIKPNFAALISFMQIMSYGIFFAVAFHYGRDAATARLILLTLALSAVGYALYGLVNFMAGNDYILWLPKWSHLDNLTASFVNRNAFAAYAGMGLLTCGTVIVRYIAQETREGEPLLPALLHMPRIMMLITAGSLLLTMALILSASRAGLASVVMGALVLWFCLLMRRILPLRILLAMMAAAIAMALLMLSGFGTTLLERLSPQGLTQDERPQIWLATLQMIKDAPLTGHGLGSYASLFLQYRTPDISLNYTQAHSTYLEMAATMGIPAALCFFISFALIAYRLMRGVITRRQNRLYSMLALAVLVQAGFHSLVDFSFQTPANAVLLVVVLGVGIAQSYSSEANS